MAMEKKSDERILELLQQCFGEGLITINQMTKGFSRVKDGIDDLALDIPDAKEKFQSYVEEYGKKKGWLLSSFLEGSGGDFSGDLRWRRRRLQRRLKTASEAVTSAALEAAAAAEEEEAEEIGIGIEAEEIGIEAEEKEEIGNLGSEQFGDDDQNDRQDAHTPIRIEANDNALEDVPTLDVPPQVPLKWSTRDRHPSIRYSPMSMYYLAIGERTQ
ncbi:uncharacterized protein A4U43_UnF7070 [Asparagus officinalis]|uniref:MI domain-containing protein n=1 Tax=Asparagus officinalis TaxID=4686 RepID=A0A1R3L6B9_ASPOF|nr:uncharacterized protein A4U43_UnF7070 [Asparagus officinalis]